MDSPGVVEHGDSATAAVEFRRITKRFPGQLAVDDVSFSVHPGEVHGLVGENGAGKSTLIRVLAGDHRADDGEILIAGQVVDIRHPRAATAMGVGFIHQEPALFPSMSVGENLAIGTGYQTSRAGIIDWGGQYAWARPLLDEVGLDIDPHMRLSELSTHQRQLVALAHVLAQASRVVVLDEVTAPLTQSEVRRLFHIIRGLRSRGVAIIYVSHRLREIFDLADRVTVLRNGRWVATECVSDLDQDELTRLIIGSDPRSLFRPAEHEVTGEVILSVRDLSDDVLDGVSFDLHRGEILGLAGLAGAGRTNVLESIFGLHRPHTGTVTLEGRSLRLGAPERAVKAGVALVTEERKVDGFIARFSLARNITLPWLRLFSRRGYLDLSKEREAAEAVVKEFDVRARSVETVMSELSGGNQQKAILARWLWQPIKILLLDEPTHGVDIGAKQRIYDIIRRMSDKGVAVILVSSEMEELEGLSQRVLLLAEGRLVGELQGRDIEKGRMLEELYRAMSGTTLVS